MVSHGLPRPVLSILALYLWFVLSLGPRLMASRPPYKIKNFMRLYNIIQVLHNGYMLSKLIFYGWNYLCSKLLDLMDTVFLVLRKKNVSFLHVYHHTAMVACFWATLSYIKFYQGTPVVAMNVFVHFVMYSYFFLATFPQLKPYLWWKKHPTKLQMVQFVAALAYLGLLYTFNCPVTRSVNYLWMANIFVILLLFVNFYFRTYVISPSSDETVKGKKL